MRKRNQFPRQLISAASGEETKVLEGDRDLSKVTQKSGRIIMIVEIMLIVVSTILVGYGIIF